MKCDVKKCKNPIYLMYRGYQVCQEHWEKHCDDTKRFSLLKAFNLEPGVLPDPMPTKTDLDIILEELDNAISTL